MLVKRLVVLAALAAIVIAGGCTHHDPMPTVPEVVAVVDDRVPEGPDDPAWSDAPVHLAKLILQDMVEPRLLELSTGEVRVQAATDRQRIAFRLQWADSTDDNLPGAAQFSDACAVQLPAGGGADVPAPQMGEDGRAVEIAYWRASWQAVVDGRGDTIQALYPNATVDHYPFEAAALEPGSDAQREMHARYAPARSLGNRMAGPRDRSVQDLEAEGPGTLRPADAATSVGRGERTSDGWKVVIVRSLPEVLQEGKRSIVAFAIWEGSREEVGARKMRTGWIPLSIGGGS